MFLFVPVYEIIIFLIWITFLVTNILHKPKLNKHFLMCSKHIFLQVGAQVESEGTINQRK